MPDPGSTEAAELVLGLLEGAEREAVEHRMNEIPAFRGAVEAWSSRLMPLLDDIQPMTPPPSVWQAIQARLPAGGTARRRQEGVWMELAPGARMKLLAVNPETSERTALLRLDPGCVFPSHAHDQMEECLVLEGSVEIDGIVYAVGDYVAAHADTRHSDIPSSAGALVLLHWNALAA
jgi:anti-sigma factor ChrR (cupin superfamily)